MTLPRRLYEQLRDLPDIDIDITHLRIVRRANFGYPTLPVRSEPK